MPRAKNERATEAIIEVVKPVLKGVLSMSIQEFFSEAQWDEIVARTVTHLEPYLQNCYPLKCVLNEGDVLDEKGNVNAAAVINGLRTMASQAKRPGQKEKLNHLADHMRVIFTDLRLLKGGDPDAN